MWWEPGSAGLWMQLWRPRWSCACLLRLTYRRIYRYLRELSAWTSSYLTWGSSADSSPRAAPNRNGPDMDCRYPKLQDHYRGPGHSRWDPEATGSHLNAEPDVSGNGQAATGCWDTAGEDRKRPVRVWNAEP